MKIFGILILAAVVSGKPSSSIEEFSVDYFNGNQFEQEGRWEDWRDSSALSGSSEELALASGDWRMEALDYTNKLRAKAGLKPYKLESRLSVGAQAYAEQIACGIMEHDVSSDGFVAENIATAYANMEKGESARKGIDSWYNEHKLYTCRKITIKDVEAKDDYYRNVGHFVNIMTKQNSMVGFGMAFCPENPGSDGTLVARFDQTDDDFSDLYTEQMKKQGITNTKEMDFAAFVPCTNTFSP